MIKVTLPAHLQSLAGSGKQVEINIEGQVTANSILDALENQYPALKGTIREHATGNRRAYLRFFACGEDISHESQDKPLQDKVANGEEPFIIMGAISGG